MAALPPSGASVRETLQRTRNRLSVRGYLVLMVVTILLPVLLFAAILLQRYYDSEIAASIRNCRTTHVDWRSTSIAICKPRL